MSRYIDADKLIYSYVPIAPVLKGDSISYEWVAYKAEIDAMPAADVRKNITAHKVIGGGEHDGATCWFECSRCGKTVDVNDKYCSECGAMFEP